MNLPGWLIQKLYDDNPDGVTRAARLGRCIHCHTPVVRGLDDDTCALAVETEPHTLDALGEYLALARAIPTYNLARRAGRWELDHRNRWAIANPQRRYAVVPAHRCHTIHPATGEQSLTQYAPPTTAASDSPPPF